MKREKYILPTIDEILPKPAHAKVFSLLDAATGFLQIPLDPESAKLTTFITPFGRFIFNRLPFGITRAPEIYQREMAEILKDLEGVATYIDDILFYAETNGLHEERLQNTLDTLKRAGLKLNNDKCLLRQRRLNYLGHCIDEDGIRRDQSPSHHPAATTQQRARAPENLGHDSLPWQVPPKPVRSHQATNRLVKERGNVGLGCCTTGGL